MQKKYCISTIFVPLLLLSSASQAEMEWGEWILDPSLQWQYQDNLNYSAFSEDELSDNLLQLEIITGRILQLTDFTRARFTVGVQTSFYQDFDDLNNSSVTAGVSVQHKFGTGLEKPWVRPELFYTYANYSDSIRSDSLLQGGTADLRTGDTLTVGIMAGKRVNDRLDINASVHYHDRDGRSGPVVAPGISTDVFDQQGWTLGLNGNYLLTSRWLLSAGYKYYNGDMDSSCTPDNVGKVFENATVNAITLDNVFGGCVYKLDGRANMLSLDLGYAIGQHSSLNLGVRYQAGSADDLDYSNTSVQASYMYSY